MALKILPQLDELRAMVEKSKIADDLTKMGLDLSPPGGPPPVTGGLSPDAPTYPLPEGQVGPPSPLPPGATEAPPELLPGGVGAVDKIVGGLEKVNKVLEAFPILGHLLRSTKGELQERELPAKERIAQAGVQQDMWEQLMENARAAAANQSRVDAAGISAGASERGAKMRAEATEHAAGIAAKQREISGKGKEITNLLKSYDDADDDTQEMMREHLRGLGLDVAEPQQGESFSLDALINGGIEALKGVYGKIADRWRGGGSKPPLSSFQK